MCNYCNLEGLEYENIHSHSMYSNIYTPDSIISKEDIAKRAVELGQKTLSLVEHGYFANIFETYDISKKYGLSLIFGSEFYFVKDRFEKDRTNSHLLVMAKNEKGREEITEMVSESNKTGFYFKPRIDEELLFNLTPENVIVTTACIASPINKYEDYAEYFIKKCKEHFGDNFFLEVQPHTNIKQVEFNKKLKEYRKEYSVPFILGIDSHYIYADDAKNRDLFLQGKNIYYPEEEGFIIDFPTVEDILKRLSEQAVLSEDEIIEAFESTLIAREFEPVKLDDDIKMPTIYPNLSHEEKVGKLHEIINNAWKEDRKHIPKDKWKEYLEAIKFETDIITGTNMEDYFLLNHKIIAKATSEYGGVLTRTGRGCFTSDALVVTKESLKTIDKVVVGDIVVTDDGKWNKVIDTMEYTIDEDMIEFTYQLQGSTYKKYKNQCTTDHKILIHRNSENIYIPASELKVGDLLCSPMIKNDNEVNEDIVIDLNNYNFDNYEYDDNYIYERFASSTGYEYSPRQLDSMGICSHNFAKKIISSEISSLNINREQGKRNVKNILEKTPFKTLENYKRYGEKHGYTVRPIPRFIKLDSLWNTFLGMMYGDGCTVKVQGVSMAVNKTTKSGYNSYVFYKIANRMSLDVVVNEAISGKNLIQLTISSKILNNWFKSYLFESKKGRDKMFNQELLFNQKTSRIKCLYNGLFRTDGSLNLKENKHSFDNTSLSIINAFKIMSSMLGNEPLSTDVRFGRTDDRGYINAESYKVRRPIVRKRNIVQKDESYWYLPVENIIEHKNVKTKVYDLSIENNHSYMINNIIVHNSAPSMYINKLFGFTEIDRLEAPITLYPTRFMSKSRILETRSLPD